MSETIDPSQTNSYVGESGEIYDLVYGYKDYEGEAGKVAASLKRRIKSGGNDLLEVACGTGNYLTHLRNDFNVSGFDLSDNQIAGARVKLPDIELFTDDMVTFNTGRQYDAVICLFSSIGYVLTTDRLNQTIENFAKHTKQGGAVMVEPWLMPDKFITGHISIESADDGKTYVSRMGTSSRKGNVSLMQMHFMVGRGEQVEHFVENHELGMFTHDELARAFELAGLELEVDAKGLTGRGLYIGTKK